MSLIELIMAGTIMAMIAGTMGMLAMSVEQTYGHSTSQAMANQHARVALQRIERAVSRAHASESFPGFTVFEEQVADHYFPQLLVVWHPDGSPAEPDGMPRVNELVVFCPHPQHAQRLLEVTSPDDSRPVPPLSDVATWKSELAAMITSGSSHIVELTDQVRRADVTPDDGQAHGPRAAVRFHVEYFPALADWQAYKAGTIQWSDLEWPQGLAADATGVRRCWCRIELQLAADSSLLRDENTEQHAIPFFGSATIQHRLAR